MRRFGWLGLLLGALLAGCGGGTYDGVDAPSFAPLPAPQKAGPRVALVLGSGGSRGFGHIGVLKALEANGITADFIVGASAGAIVGALYAGGLDAAALDRLAMEMRPRSLIDISMLDRAIKGRALQDFVNEQVGGKPLEKLKHRLVVVATDTETKTLTYFNRGNTGVAVRASSAIPGRFVLVSINGGEYVDADVVSPVPINVARALGAEVIIAVNVAAHLEDTPESVPANWKVRDRARKKLVDAEAVNADVLIHPNPGYFACWEQYCRQRVIDVAEAATLALIPRIKSIIAEKTKRPAPG